MVSLKKIVGVEGQWQLDHMFRRHLLSAKPRYPKYQVG
jgi:hypothetical protein